MVNKKYLITIIVVLNLLMVSFCLSKPFYAFVGNESLDFSNLLDYRYSNSIIEKARFDANLRYAITTNYWFNENIFDFAIIARSLEPLYDKFIIHSIRLANKKKIICCSTNTKLESNFKIENEKSVFQTYQATIWIFKDKKMRVSVCDKYKINVDCEIIDLNHISYRKSITFEFDVIDKNGFPWCLFGSF